MFICDECLMENYTNQPSTFFRSYGRCEICGISRSCSDIYHAHLEKRRKKK